jgi:hypothetical protein
MSWTDTSEDSSVFLNSTTIVPRRPRRRIRHHLDLIGVPGPQDG